MTEGHELTFPDDSRAELDRALEQLVSKAHTVLADQGRLRSLLKANEAIVENLELPIVLRRIVEAAVDLVGAEYGALGIVAADGGTLEQFIHVGMTPETVTEIGRLPQGHGLLGALIQDRHAIRLDDRTDDSRSIPLPRGHPPMRSFLGVPVRVRDEVYGNLYLSNQASGSFSQEDEQLVTALAATAGVAIENARLYAETQRRQAWTTASAEITSTLVSSDEAASISTLTARVLRLAEADVVWLLMPTDDPAFLQIETARGIDELRLQGTTFSLAGSIVAGVLEGHQPRQADDASASEPGLSDDRRMGPVMAVPLMADGHPHGVLFVGRIAGSARFTVSDLEMIAGFAGQGSLAIELALARADRQRLMLLDDRGRIARDLHDHVIQQLFATGLELQNLAGSVTQPAVAEGITRSVVNLDAAISQIRTVIFAITVPRGGPRDTVRHQILDVATELAPNLAVMPTVTFSGPVDLIVTDDLADDVVAVTREALTNVVKHARANRATVSLAVLDGTVVLEVVDDGHGTQGSGRRSGIANLHERAIERGGAFDFDSGTDGTRLRWSVPYGSVATETQS